MAAEIEEPRYCSWCFVRGRHDLLTRNYLRRNVYRCRSCKNSTLECVACRNMTRGQPAGADGAPMWKRVAQWDDSYCAEHDGSIGSFDALASKLETISAYRTLVEGEAWNLARVSGVAVGVIGGIGVVAPLAVVGAPALAAALGGWGLLGTTATTGTAISSLSGAALTSASLAAIGGGATAAGGLGMAGGTVIITATGAALGGVRGGVLTNSYIGGIKDFDIRGLRDRGDGAQLVFVNGFLQQKETGFEDWLAGTQARFGSRRAYGLTWESKTLAKLGAAFTGGGEQAAARFMAKAAARGARKGPGMLTTMAGVFALADLFENPWTVAMVKAGMTGVTLADIISRTDGRKQHTLMGHSLGSRVIFYALEALATKRRKPIQDVYLLGGAVDRKDAKAWTHAASAVRGTIYNCYSGNDDVLRWLYQGANALLSRPVGLGPIESDAPNIVNVDVSDLVAGHMDYKAVIPEILDRIHARRIEHIEPDPEREMAREVFEAECPYCGNCDDAEPGRPECTSCGLTYELAKTGKLYFLENEITCHRCAYTEPLMVMPGYEFFCPDCQAQMWPAL